MGVSSRWWYLPGMYNPVVERCRCCSGKESSGQKLTRRMAESVSGPVVGATGQLYRIPLVDQSGDEAKECISWPRYLQGEYAPGKTGSSTIRLIKNVYGCTPRPRRDTAERAPTQFARCRS